VNQVGQDCRWQIKAHLDLKLTTEQTLEELASPEVGD